MSVFGRSSSPETGPQIDGGRTIGSCSSEVYYVLGYPEPTAVVTAAATAAATADVTAATRFLVPSHQHHARLDNVSRRRQDCRNRPAQRRARAVDEPSLQQALALLNAAGLLARPAPIVPLPPDRPPDVLKHGELHRRERKVPSRQGSVARPQAAPSPALGAL
ncbi:uncharacterized protein PgNI_09603 [Pyricularia grisea]|uniref:Uncharacterized protein n=1 Tax=Pyricularia grisea TaxID=148305 RepID=A0A6P8ASU7_PYRGI|nr:uncharacterized protein PgNI_09603 [Pyricularia grisea]TLD05177.1 hypothetical protein PgNI_09603 [Pyricularia grisea]